MLSMQQFLDKIGPNFCLDFYITIILIVKGFNLEPVQYGKIIKIFIKNYFKRFIEVSIFVNSRPTISFSCSVIFEPSSRPLLAKHRKNCKQHFHMFTFTNGEGILNAFFLFFLFNFFCSAFDFLTFFLSEKAHT